MRLQPDTEHVLFRAEAGDTVDRIASLIDLLGGLDARNGSKTLGLSSPSIQPADDRLPFLIIVPKDEGIDDTLLTLCAVYLRQQRIAGLIRSSIHRRRGGISLSCPYRCND